MKEYVEKGAALEATYAPFTMSMCMTVPECNGMNRARKMIFKQLRDIPAADVVEVVRCRDCAKREICRTSNTWAVAPSDDWFCADGERKGGDE